jgi:hypothetical protein
MLSRRKPPYARRDWCELWPTDITDSVSSRAIACRPSYLMTARVSPSEVPPSTAGQGQQPRLAERLGMARAAAGQHRNRATTARVGEDGRGESGDPAAVYSEESPPPVW